MATLQVLGTAPVTFIGEDSTSIGHQYQIPLMALEYDPSTGEIDAKNWEPVSKGTLPAEDGKVLTSLLADLLKRGVLTPATS
jgi:hypothetical protein